MKFGFVAVFRSENEVGINEYFSVGHKSEYAYFDSLIARSFAAQMAAFKFATWSASPRMWTCFCYFSTKGLDLSMPSTIKSTAFRPT